MGGRRVDTFWRIKTNNRQTELLTVNGIKSEKNKLCPIYVCIMTYQKVIKIVFTSYLHSCLFVSILLIIFYSNITWSAYQIKI